MKTCIVTVYDSINCGSYWQAFALGDVLRQMGCEVQYLRRNQKGASSSTSTRIRAILSNCWHGRFAVAGRYLLAVKKFRRFQSKLNIVDETDGIDCFVLGSDTIWNMDSQYFREHASTYWGIDFFPRKTITYAASAANTKAEKITQELHDAVGKLYAVSVRDQHTRELVKDDTDKEIRIVCDPTLLLVKSDYRKYIGSNTEKKGYVYLYLNAPLSHKQGEELKAFCRDKGLNIINGFTYNKPDYCDKCIVAEPESFLTYMFYADYIVTDTFHGTVFSANFNKQFVSLTRGKNKVKEFLDICGLTDRGHEDDAGMVSKLSCPIDYAAVNAEISALREKSLSYLRETILE